MSSKILTILDAAGENASFDLNMHWHRRDIPLGHYSAPALAEARLHATRDEFLDWVHQAGELEVDGKSVAQHLALNDGFSAWWLSPLFERYPLIYGKALFEIFKLRALELFLEQFEITEVVLYSNDARLICAVTALCAASGRECKIAQPSQTKPAQPFIARIKSWCRKQGVRHVAVAAVLNIRFLLRWLMATRRHFPRKPKVSPGGGIVVGTWFPNHDLKAAARGQFVSSYIPGLMPILEQSADHVHWFFMQARDDAAEAVRQRDKVAGAYAGMTFWEECVGLSDIPGVLAESLRMVCAASKLEGHLDRLSQWPGSRVNIRAYIQKLWDDGIVSDAMLSRLLLRRGIKNYVRAIGPQRVFLTTSELQFWERLLFCEAHKQNIPCIALQHSVISEVGFRTCLSEKMAANTDLMRQLPDVFVCNGNAARDVMVRGGCPPSMLRMAETLRYQYLREVSVKTCDQPHKLVVITGYGVDEVQAQFDLLLNALRNGAGSRYSEIVIKGHPVHPVSDLIKKMDFAQYGVVEIKTPVGEMLKEPAVFYVANSTAVAIEVMYARHPLIVQGVEDDFNFSPLAGQKGICFVHTPQELRQALENPQPATLQEDFFFFGAELGEWKKLLADFM
ncbi:TIGR04326 family surface carbohydrate biosynthesis protein [Desulfovibrio intestinalis]|uniref:Surface carbohydrate biosynthesis protein (TIGR04326 family) n=1 Tax=Desulfovibrio intestinalis TaxID=58621 RepID=A0A7W8C389_9BACT|nr:TIGR04326 family surface carbohydrate biosynthesis protein [Desulfovibrio intestinalis]MBB5144788.1 surface carbohydrate biosynthesis protein (TIGR04326 family) [Desulfovibrio intestinalis]